MFSALEIFLAMRYINLLFTYLFTYFLQPRHLLPVLLFVPVLGSVNFTLLVNSQGLFLSTWLAKETRIICVGQH